MTKKLAALSLSMSVAACGPLISFGESNPQETYALGYSQTQRVAEQAIILHVDEPVMNNGIGGRKISVSLDGMERTTLKDVRWSDNLADLMRSNMVQHIRDNAGWQTLGEGMLDVRAHCRLGVSVQAFEFVPGVSASDDQVNVQFDAMLVRLEDSALLGRFPILKNLSVGGSGNADIVAALQTAFRMASDDLARALKPLGANCLNADG